MKEILQHINKAFDNRIRLGIMSVLMVNDSVDFNTLKELLDVTDGNLASHTKALESEEYIIVEKKYADEAWINDVEEKVKATVEASVKFAEESPIHKK